MTTDAHGNIHGNDGRFAGHIGTESTAELRPQRLDELRPNLEISDEKVVEIVMEAASSVARRDRNADREEIAAEILLHLTTVWKNENAEIKNPKSQIYTLAHGVGMRQQHGAVRGPDMKAIKILSERRRIIEDERQEPMSDAEVDRLATEILMSFPPGKRPTVGFHRKGSQGAHRSLDATDEDGRSPADHLVAPEQTRDLNLDQQTLIDMARSTSQRKRDAAATQYWDAVAEEQGRPATRATTLTDMQVKSARDLVARNGGAAKVAAQVRHGNSDLEVESAFMHPWGDQYSDDDLDAVTEAFTANPAAADRIWEGTSRRSVMRRDEVHGARDWSTVQSATGLRQVAPVIADEKLQVRARRLVMSTGGAGVLASKVLTGKATEAETRVLMAPWGGRQLGGPARRIATVLSHHPHADRVWSSAFEAALDAGQQHPAARPSNAASAAH